MMRHRNVIQSEAQDELQKPSPQAEKSKQPPFYQILTLLVLWRVTLSALFPVISDCDEVFNYWEPTHYLNYGYGMQTWEYAPRFAIRSWTYAGLHAFLLQVTRLLGVASKYDQFIVLRCFLAAVCALSEALLYKSVQETISPRAAHYFLLISALSPGMYIASAAYLPSSFAMCTTALAFSTLFQSYKLEAKTQYSPVKSTTQRKFIPTMILNPFKSIGVPIFIVAVGAIVGWPFSGAIAIPFVFEEVFIRSWHVNKPQYVSVKRIFFQRLWMVVYSSVASIILILVPLVLIDSKFYGQWVFVPFNIVLYNVFKVGGGPEIYGTEPWYFYLVNGFLNFNVAFVVAFFSLPVLLLSRLIAFQSMVTSTCISFLVQSAGRPYSAMMFKMLPMYLWILTFIVQSHKEERFLFVIYPLISLNAALSICFIRSLFSKYSWDNHKFPLLNKLPSLVIKAFFVIFAVISFMRIVALNVHYGAQLSIYGYLNEQIEANQNSNITVCYGGEWYRFPSHFLLNDKARIAWLDEGQGGQLPKYFVNGIFNTEIPFYKQWISQRPGTRFISQETDGSDGFNGWNKKVASRYVERAQCDYTVQFHHFNEPMLEMNYFCLPFMDAQASDSLQRAFYIPFYGVQKKRWGSYCFYIMK